MPVWAAQSQGLLGTMSFVSALHMAPTDAWTLGPWTTLKLG